MAALDGFRNADGGYGWGLEPDLRARGSQPVAALHAFEVFEECGPATFPQAAQLCDWLDGITLADGGLPFALPFDGADAAGAAPFWAESDPRTSSLHMTSELAAAAHRVGVHDARVRGHGWLGRATEFCRLETAALTGPPNAVAFRFIMDFLDTVHDRYPWAAAELERLAVHLPHGAAASLSVEGGAEGEALRPLDFSPRPGRPIRKLFDASAVEAELDELAAGQHPDGGWSVDWTSAAPAGALEWRGHATVHALTVLRDHGRVPGAAPG